MIGDKERVQLLQDFQGIQEEKPIECVVGLMKKQADLHSEKKAAVFGDECISYGELWKEAQRLASKILSERKQ